MQGFDYCAGTCGPSPADVCQACCDVVQCKAGLVCSGGTNKCFVPSPANCAELDNTDKGAATPSGFMLLSSNKNRALVFKAPADTCGSTISISKVGLGCCRLLPSSLKLPQLCWHCPPHPFPQPPTFWCSLPQITLGLCQAASPTTPIFVSLNLVDGSNNPVGVGTADLKRSELTITTGQLPLCTNLANGGGYRTLDFPLQLTAGTKYAVTVGSAAAFPGNVWWTRPSLSDTTPSPPQYFVGYRQNDSGEYDSSEVYNAIRVEFVCGA